MLDNQPYFGGTRQRAGSMIVTILSAAFLHLGDDITSHTERGPTRLCQLEKNLQPLYAPTPFGSEKRNNAVYAGSSKQESQTCLSRQTFLNTSGIQAEVRNHT